MTLQLADIKSSSIFFDVHFFKFSYWPKLHINIIFGYGTIKIFVFKGMTKIWKLEIPPSEFGPIFGDWGK